MSKQAGNNVKPQPVKLDTAGIQKAVEDRKAAIEKHAVERAARDTGKQNPVVATNKLQNDAFDVYSDVDVDALTEAAVNAYKEGERSARREGQMQIANILARYHQDKLIGDANPVNLYKNDKLQIGTVQLIARTIYCVSEKTMDGKKNPLPRNLEMRVRNIAPVIFYAIQERIPLVWSEEEDALLVPTWLATSDVGMVEAFKTNPESRVLFSKPVALDGKEGRSLANILKRVPDPSKTQRTPTANSTAGGGDKHAQALKLGMTNAGLSRVLVQLTEMFVQAPNKPFSDDILESLAVCVEHVKTRNGSDAMGAAIKSMSADKPKAPSKPAQAKSAA